MNSNNSVDHILDYLLDPITGSPARVMEVIGVIDLHVDDLFVVGNQESEYNVLRRLRRDFQVGSEE